MLDIGELSTIPAGCKLFKKEADVEISVVLLDEIVPVELYLLQGFFRLHNASIYGFVRLFVVGASPHSVKICVSVQLVTLWVHPLLVCVLSLGFIVGACPCVSRASCIIQHASCIMKYASLNMMP